jgi:hypothetical protein
MKLLLLSFSCVCMMACQADETENTYNSGKKKIAYTPHQTATLNHIKPIVQIQKETPVAAVQGINTKVDLSKVTTSQADTTGLNQLNTQHIITQASIQANTQARAKVKVKQSTTPSQKSAQKQSGSSISTKASTVKKTEVDTPSERNKIAAGWPKGQAPTQKKQGVAPTRPNSQPTSRPSSHPSSQPTSQPTALGGVIHGEITIKPELLSKIKANSIMFVIVRRYAPKGQKGMMIAAIKVENIKADRFPLRYAVTPKDAMMGAPLAGKVRVSARIDQDGDAISKQPGDLIGSAEKAIMVGVNPVKFTIDSSL